MTKFKVLSPSPDPESIGMTEWERQREREEFVRISRVYQPLSTSLSARFTKGETEKKKSEVCTDCTERTLPILWSIPIPPVPRTRLSSSCSGKYVWRSDERGTGMAPPSHPLQEVQRTRPLSKVSVLFFKGGGARGAIRPPESGFAPLRWAINSQNTGQSQYKPSPLNFRKS